MLDVAVQDALQEILELLRGIAAGNDEMLTEEQVAVRLSLTVPRLQRRMKDGSLPKGIVWFERPGLGRYFSWRALCSYITSRRETSPREAAIIDSMSDEPIPQMSNRGTGRRNNGSQA
jgi:hypothetical protein